MIFRQDAITSTHRATHLWRLDLLSGQWYSGFYGNRTERKSYDPEILGGTPVFIGTPVPAQALIDDLEAGQPLDEFLDDFLRVTREQAVAALEQAKEILVSRARAAG
jgi:uncharacterized protein (DUF433 family)